MSEKNKNITLIERYLAGELVGEEETNFEQRLQNDQELMNEMNEIKVLKAGIKASVLEEKMSFLEKVEEEISISEDEEEENDPPSQLGKRKGNSRRLWWTVSSAAAIILLLIWAWPQFQTSGPSEEYKDFFENRFEETIEHVLFRSLEENTDLSEDQIYAYNLYVDKQFKVAIPQLKKLWKTQKDSLAFKYLGYSYLGIGKNQKGEEILNNFSSNELQN